MSDKPKKKLFKKTTKEVSGAEVKQRKKLKLQLPKIKKEKAVGTEVEKKPGRDGKKKSDKSAVMIFSIRNKIVISFLVPIVFMVIIGVASYQKASEGMQQKYLESTTQTLNMAVEYVDMGYDFIKSEGINYAYDEEINKYFFGMYENNAKDKLDVLTRIKTDVMSVQTVNSFISHIHLIPESDMKLISTTGNNKEGFLTDYLADIQQTDDNLSNWVDRHPLLDEIIEIPEDSYIMAYQLMSKYKESCVIIDIAPDMIEELLGGLDLGDGSIVGFVTPTGREVICEKLSEGEVSILSEGEQVFFDEAFYSSAIEAVAADENMAAGSSKVSFKGEDYYFVYSISPLSGVMICSVVPETTVISQAQEIKALTIGIVLLACVAVLVVGVLIAMGIQNNTKRISKKLEEVAEGDLTVEVSVKSRDELRSLAGSANHMIDNTKKLVNKVSQATDQLEESSVQVEQVSTVINNYSQDITQAIAEINEGMMRQSSHAQECVEKTTRLSGELQEVNAVISKVEKLVEETGQMINQGMGIVQLLGQRAEETTAITGQVGESIEALRKESEVINTFVGTITDISEQTNLLSLNASIEAARAGEAGRGFSVVAEEIRKLADDSARAAGEIRRNVEHIGVQTQNSVESAHQARSMVDLQTQAVGDVIAVFREMQERMNQLIDGLKDIVANMDQADDERSATVEAVRNISDIIEETASSAETVHEVAEKLLHNVEKLNSTADVLGENMAGLKTEISVFKI